MPAFQSSAQTAWDTTTSPKTVNVSCNAGDLVLVYGVTENSTTELQTPTGGGLTYTSAAALGPSSGYTCLYLWWARTATTQTITFSVSVVSSSGRWGFGVMRWICPPGVGAVATNRPLTTGTGQISMLPQSNSCSVAYVQGDGNAISGASRTWNTVDAYTPTSGNGLERTYDRQASHYTIYAAYWPTVYGTTAPEYELFGLSGPSGQLFSAIAAELLSNTTVFAAANFTAESTLTAAGARVANGEAMLSASSALFCAVAGFGTVSLSAEAILMVAAQPTLRTYTTYQAIPANPGPGNYDSWFGAELQYADGFDPDNPTALTVTGGFFFLTSLNAFGPDETVRFESDTGLKLNEEWFGDAGYHVHFVQPPGPGFVLWVCLEYTIF